MNSNRLQNAKRYVLQLEYLTKLLRYYETDKYVTIMMDGFIDYHKTICQRPECPSRQKFVKNKRFQKIFKKETDTETIIQLIHLIDSFYNIGISKFPNDEQLKISHALFLLDKFQQKQQALQELINLENKQLSFDQQFVVHQFISLIEYELQDEKQAKQQEQFQDYDYILHKNYVEKLKQSIDVNVQNYIEFWNQLREDIPNLTILKDTGYKILEFQMKIKEKWKVLNEMKINIQWIDRLYMNYCQLILNDKYETEMVIKQIKRKDYNKIKLNSEVDISQQMNPVIFISADPQNIGIVTNINLAASSIFSYSKEEVINKKINGFMPNMYSQYHDTFISNYLQTHETRILNQQSIFPVKNKMNYINPVQMVVTTHDSIINGTQFLAQIRMQKQFKNVCYVLIGIEDGRVENICSGCISLIGLNIQKITKQKIKIEDIIPSFYQEINHILNKKGIVSKVNTHLNDEDTYTNQKLMQVSADPVCFSQQGLQGYLIRFELLRDNDFLDEYQQDSKPFTSNDEKVFQMKYDTNNKKYVGQIETITTYPHKSQFQQCTDTTYQQSQQNKHDSIIIGKLGECELSLFNNKQHIDQQNFINKNQEGTFKTNFGSDIRIMRLFDGKIKDIDEFKIVESSQDEEQGLDDQIFMQNNLVNIDEFQKAEDIQNMSIFRSRETFQNYLDEKNCRAYRIEISNDINILIVIQVLTVFLIGLYLIIGICNFIIIDRALTITKDGYELVYKSGRRQSLIQICLLSLIQINQLQNDWLSISNDPIKKQRYFQKQIKYIDSYISKLQKLQTELLLKQDIYNNNNINKLLNTNIIDMHSLESGRIVIRKQNLNDATKQIIVKILEIKVMSLENFAINKPNYYFLHFNMLNDYALAIQATTQLYVMQLQKRSSFGSNYENQFLISTLILMVMNFMITILTCDRIIKYQNQIMKIFLEIPIQQVKTLLNSVTQFINITDIDEEQSNNHSQTDSSEREQDDEGDTFLNLGIKRQRRQRKYKSNSASRIQFSIALIFVAFLMQVYFIADYIFSYELEALQQKAVQELNITSNIEHELSFMSNLISNHITTPNIQVYGIYTNYVIPQQNAKLYLYISALETMHMRNVKNLNSDYENTFTKVMKKGVCDIFVNILKTHNTTECQTFSYGIINQGISIALSNQVQNYEYMLQLIQYYTNKLESPYLHNDEGDLLLVKTNNKTLNNFIQALDSSRSQRSLKLQQEYLFPIFEYLGDQFIRMMNKDFDSLYQIRLSLLIYHCITLAFLYLVFRNQVIQKINISIIRLKQMSIIIPTYLISQNRNIRLHLKMILNNNDNK